MQCLLVYSSQWHVQVGLYNDGVCDFVYLGTWHNVYWYARDSVKRNRYRQKSIYVFITSSFNRKVKIHLSSRTSNTNLYQRGLWYKYTRSFFFSNELISGWAWGLHGIYSMHAQCEIEMTRRPQKSQGDQYVHRMCSNILRSSEGGKLCLHYSHLGIKYWFELMSNIMPFFIHIKSKWYEKCI